MTVSVLIPVYNSARYLKSVVKGIMMYLEENAFAYELILVDDCSDDRSWHEIETLCSQYDAIKGIHLSKNAGQQKSLYTGLHFCYGDYILTLDDDGQHDIRYFPSLLAEAKKGADLVYGVYDAHGGDNVRALGSKWVSGFFKNNYEVLKGNRVSSYRLIDKHLCSQILHHKKPFVYLSAELLAYAKLVANVTIERKARIEGKSGYTLWKCLVIVMKLHLYYGKGLINLRKRRSAHETCIDGWCGKLSTECHSKIEATWL